MSEKASQRFTGFDLWSTCDAVQAMYEGQLMAVSALSSALGELARAADIAALRLGDSGRLVYVGAGTSGRLGVLDGSELGPTFGWPLDRVVYCMAGGLAALTVSAEGAEDNRNGGQAAIRNNNISKHDVVIGITASGSTPYTVGALEAAGQVGALTIGIGNNPGTAILKAAAHPILIETGSEIIAGSTRMKAGTAQKAALNILSTAIMARLGKVYDGLMVDMIPSNNKLDKRSVKMVCDITGCPEETAVTALGESGKNVKLAVLIVNGKSLNDSKQLLADANGNLRDALQNMES